MLRGSERERKSGGPIERLCGGKRRVEETECARNSAIPRRPKKERRCTGPRLYYPFHTQCLACNFSLIDLKKEFDPPLLPFHTAELCFRESGYPTYPYQHIPL